MWGSVLTAHAKASQKRGLRMIVRVLPIISSAVLVSLTLGATCGVPEARERGWHWGRSTVVLSGGLGGGPVLCQD